MRLRSGIRAVTALALALSAVNLPSAAHAQDFFSALFRAFGARPPARSLALPYPGEPGEASTPRIGYGGQQAWCVRSCDGRYFPITGSDGKSRTAACNGFCPASQTTLVYGGDIDHAFTERGERYSDLPNAFRYRQELVAGCTCNGKDPTGLASIPIDKDPTLRKGDIVAGAHGLEVATRTAGQRGGANFTPLPRSTQARYRQLPVVAAGQ